MEVDTEERCSQILKNAKYKRENEKGFDFYITPTPLRNNDRFFSYSDEEINPIPRKKPKKSDINKKFRNRFIWYPRLRARLYTLHFLQHRKPRLLCFYIQLSEL